MNSFLVEYKSPVTKKAKKPNNKDAAKSVSSKNSIPKPQSDEASASIKESDVDKMSAQEYEKHAEAITAAIRSGNFIYDLSGSAR